ncbi:hypothetical protein DM01DRAFT_1408762 [Hesseltinella vesiculosa]|uniref:Metallo-beta-lactamase domain-containing protein n=1 Tax=Hesseltinella vesiculosa TaxID=101127 RepID=A0A1X2GDN1_9FUNG|nr:hypothetical protein DM01DRAFT_1408762 [Hesseltinella vesiculosa]
MSTFDGQIREYPAICIDRFTQRKGARYYFLTHVHSDHTHGLTHPDFYETIYCSEPTAIILPEIRRRGKRLFSHLQHRLKGWPLLKEQLLTTTEYGVLTITFIPANHCPGAVMILIEGCNGTILYTGDVRAEESFIKDLPILGDKHIDHLYMDTTCCDDLFKRFLPKDESIRILIDYIVQKPSDTQFYLDCWTFGYEEIWIAISLHFNTKVHVSPARYQLYCLVDEDYRHYLTSDPSSTRFHSCEWQFCDECIPDPSRAICIHPVPRDGIVVIKYTSMAGYLLRSDLPDTPNVALQVLLPFSTHSSLTEIGEFIDFVGPDRMTPIVSHEKWVSMEAIHRVLDKHGCKYVPSGRSTTSPHSKMRATRASIQDAAGEAPPKSLSASAQSTLTWHGSVDRLDEWATDGQQSGTQSRIVKTSLPARIMSLPPLSLLNPLVSELSPSRDEGKEYLTTTSHVPRSHPLAIDNHGCEPDLPIIIDLCHSPTPDADDGLKHKNVRLSTEPILRADTPKPSTESIYISSDDNDSCDLNTAVDTCFLSDDSSTDPILV